MRQLCNILLAFVLSVSFSPVAVQARTTVTFNYHISVHVQATIQRAGLRFVGARFEPYAGTSLGRMHFLISTTASCNVRMFGLRGPSLIPVFDSGPLYRGTHPAWVENVNRGDYQRFVIVSYDCSGWVQARDQIAFWTPPPQIVTTYQWEQVTVARRTVRVGYR